MTRSWTVPPCQSRMVFCVMSVCAGLTWGLCHTGSGHRSGQGLRGCLSDSQATGAWAAHWEWRLCTRAAHTRPPAEATACVPPHTLRFVPPGVWPGLWTFSSIPRGPECGNHRSGRYRIRFQSAGSAFLLLSGRLAYLGPIRYLSVSS